MFEPKTHSSFSLCLLALTMLVMSGVGFTLLIDSWGIQGELEQNVSVQRQKIIDLEQVIYSWIQTGSARNELKSGSGAD